MSDPPGKVLSSLNPCSEKRNSKLGGCAGVFFQLFDWNRRLYGKRLLSRKLLPAERPAKHGSRRPKDEKLPMAKLLLIANENRGGFPKVSTTDTEEALNKDKTPEKKKTKRSPSVVAKLMGLETMPSPEPLCKDKKRGMCENPAHKADDNVVSSNRKITSIVKTMGVNAVASGEHSSAVLTSHAAWDTMVAKPPRALICHKSDEPKISFFCKLPALSPRKSENSLRSILSPSKTHNKLLSPIKSPLATKRGSRLLEAAAKILEPNMQPTVRPRGIGSQAAVRSLSSGNTDNEDQGKSGNSVPQLPKKRTPTPIDSKKRQQQSISLRIYSDQSKTQGNKSSKQDKRSLNMVDNNAACKSQAAPLSSKRGPSQGLRRSGSTREESMSHGGSMVGQPRLMRSKSVREEPQQGKSGLGCNNELRNAREEKGKSEVTRQKRTSNRLSQPRVGSGKRELGLDSKDENFQDIENQDPNVSNHDGDGHRSQSTDSAVMNSSSGSILNYGKLFNSRKSEMCQDSTRKTQKKGDSSLMKTLLRRKGVPTDDNMKNSSKSVMRSDSSQALKSSKINGPEASSLESLTGDNYSPSESIMEKNPDGKSQEVETSLVPSLDYARSTIEVHYNVAEISRKNTMDESPKLEPALERGEVVSSLSQCTTSMDADAATLTVSLHGEASSGGDLYDSASSAYAHLELPSHRRKKAVSYSGKSTAAILQELLMALNSAKTQIAFDDSIQHMPDSSDCESSSKFTLYTNLRGDCDDSASSAAVSKDDLKKTPLASTRYARCSDDWRHSSPVSTLEFPSEDDSFTFSDSMEDSQEQSIHSKLHALKHCELESKWHHTSISVCSTVPETCKEPFECEERYIRDIVKSAKLSAVDIYSAKLHLPYSLLNPAVFNHLEEQFHQQWEWGIRPDESMYANCRSETDMHFTRSLYVEAAVQNRKLVFECIDEALNIHLGINEHHPRQSPWQSACLLSEWHISQSVCRQMEAWRAMACCMNIDDMVEQDMSTGLGKWVDFTDQVSDIAVETERSIVQGLINELVIDMGRRLPRMQCNCIH